MTTFAERKAQRVRDDRRRRMLWNGSVKWHRTWWRKGRSFSLYKRPHSYEVRDSLDDALDDLGVTSCHCGECEYCIQDEAKAWEQLERLDDA